MIKKFFICCFIEVLLLAISQVPSWMDVHASAAMQMEPDWLVTKFLSQKSGTWYDEDGNEVLRITDTSINGCAVVGGYQFAGGNPGAVGYIRIREQAGYRDIKLTIEGNWNKFLVMDDQVALQRSKHPMYTESVEGIYLGISEKKTVQKLGNPDQRYAWRDGERFVYRAYGMNIAFAHHMAIEIDLQRGYPWKLDGSGLTCDDALSTYQQVYHFKKTPYEGQYGGVAFGTDSEYMWFDKYPQQLTLNIYNN